MNLVDWVLVGAVVVFAWAGWHRGFVAGLLSFAGFLGGGLAAAFILPSVVDALIDAEWLSALALGVGVLVCALLGQFAASILGDRLRGGITWRPARVVDNLAGAGLNVLALAVVAWIVASALAYVPLSLVSQQVTESRVLVALDSIVPVPARNAFGDLRDLVGDDVGAAHLLRPRADHRPGRRSAGSRPSSRSRSTRPASRSCRCPATTPECGAAVSGSGFAVVARAGADQRARGRGRGRAPRPGAAGRPGARGDRRLLRPGHGRRRARRPRPRRPPARAGQGAARGRAIPPSSPGSRSPARSGPSRPGCVPRSPRWATTSTATPASSARCTPSGAPSSRATPVARCCDPDGFVLGMVFGADDEAESTGYALTADELRPAIESAFSSPRAVGTGSCRIRE